MLEMVGTGQQQKLMQVLSHMPPVDSSARALRVVHEAIVPALVACEAAGETELALRLEAWAYSVLVKQFERPEHYDACFEAMEGPLHRLGERAAGSRHNMEATRGRILFFFHNLGTSLAHVQLLCDLLVAYLSSRPAAGRDIGIIGASIHGRADSRIEQLCTDYAVHLSVLPMAIGMTAMFQAAEEEMERNRFGQLVVVSLPTGLSYASGRFGPERLGWLTMKFQGRAFRSLRLRYSFTAGKRKAINKGGVTFLAAPPLMHPPAQLQTSPRPSAPLQAARRFRTVLYTVNREEKIRDEVYLRVVCDLLERFSDACFVWTGRKPSAPIVEAFEDRGLVGRQFFAGWVNPDDLIGAGDVFLDTPHLSGTVAARAMVLGRPVVVWSEAHAWINFFGETIDADRAAGRNQDVIQRVDALAGIGLPLESDGATAYFEHAARLIGSPDDRVAYGEMLKAVAERYFLDRVRTAEAHFANFRGEPIND